MDKEAIAAQLLVGYISKHGIPPSKKLPKVVHQLATFHKAMVEQLQEPAKPIDLSQVASIGGERMKLDW